MKTILVIENNVDTLDIIEAFLTESEFVLEKATGIIPLDQIIDINPNVIVMDHWRENGYGAHLCFEIKNNPMTRHIPVLLYSADTKATELVPICLADDFIAKPFDLNEFEALIKKWAF